MNLSSISSGSTAAACYSPAVFQTRPTRRREADADDAAPAPSASQAQRSEGPGRRNPLVAAMMSALQSLMPTTPSATTPAPTATATPVAASTATAATPAAASTATPATTTPATTTSTSDPAALRDAAYAFAHELYNALRGSGSGEGRSDDGGEHHRTHHHHHRSEASSGYGDLAQRLTALAQKLDGSSAAPAPTATPASTTTTLAATPAATTTSATPATPAAATTPAAASASSGTTINITINVNLGGTAAAPATTTAAKTASSPLIDAFKHMFEALNPAGAAATTGPSPMERLSAFLRQMAQSLANGESSTQPVTPTSGSLLNVSA